MTYFPYSYEDYRQPKDFSNLPDKAKISLNGVVKNVEPEYFNGHRNLCRLVVQYNHGKNHINIIFFNKAWLKYKIHKNDRISLCNGTYNANYGNINGGQVQVIKTDHPLPKDHVIKMYPSSHNIKQHTIRKMIRAGYDQCHQLITDIVPKDIRDKYRLEDEAQVIHDLQFPSSMRAAHNARRTAKFNDFYRFELKLQMLKKKESRHKGININYDKKTLRYFDNHLPFKMTPGQILSVRDIVLDLNSDHRMNRLLQGDVGSGKTIVAAFGILATITAGYQAAIMVPTSVLAKQHYLSFTKVFKHFHISIALLTGDVTGTSEQTALKAIKDGNVQLIIGTDALIQDKVQYHKLGMAIIDEQHRFGVDQRKALRDKGTGVNVLAMTATPIPRTLAMTSYGDMDISVINGLPKGRKPIKTSWITRDKFSATIPFIKHHVLSKHHQAYFVVPLVQQSSDSDSNDQSDKLDALTAYKQAAKDFAPYKVGLLHGQMDEDEKDEVLNNFAKGKYDILVSTTVVEVGVDVSNATLMVIFNADNFGLAQLHQLRGRVGRNSLQSYCLLVANPKTKNGKKRMRVMEKTNNGFIISQADLKLRGTGDIFGQSQSGIPHFKVGDPIGDSVILEYARKEAQKHAKHKAF